MTLWWCKNLSLLSLSALLLCACQEPTPPAAPPPQKPAPPERAQAPHGDSPKALALGQWEHHPSPQWSPDLEPSWERRRPAHSAGLLTDLAPWKGHVLVGTQDGELFEVKDGAWTQLGPSRAAALVKVVTWEDEVGPGAVAVLDAAGAVHLSEDDGKSWKQVLEPRALEATQRSPVLRAHEIPWHDLAMRRVGGELNLAVVGTATQMAWSSDGGRRWSQQAGGEKETLLTVEIADNGTMLASGERGRGYRLGLSGDRWAQAFQPDKPMVVGLAWEPGGQDRAIAVTATGKIRWWTQEGGWAKRDALLGGARGLLWRGDGLWVSGLGGELWHSKEGERWKQVHEGDGRGALALASAPGGQLYLLGEETLLRGKPGRWEVLRGQEERALRSVHLTGAERGMAVGDLGAVLRAEEGRWEAVEPPRGQGAVSWSEVSFASGRFGWMVGGAGAVASTQDGGRSWSAQPLAGARVDLHAVGALDVRNVFVAGGQGAAWSSQDGGQSWSALSLPWPQSKAAAPPLRAVGFLRAGEPASGILLGGDRGALWRNEPQQPRFEEVALGGLTGVSRFAPGGQRFWMLDLDGVLLAQGPEQAPWSVRAVPGAMDFAALSFAPEAAVAMTTNGAWLRSRDQGRSWELARRAPRKVVHDLCAVGPSSFVAVGHGGKIYRSVDGGVDWAEIPALSSKTLTAVSCGAEEVLAVGFGGAAWESRDGGATWEPWSQAPQGLERAHLTALAVGEGGAAALGGVGVLWTREAGGAWVAADLKEGALGEVRRLRPRAQGGWWVINALGALWSLEPGQSAPKLWEGRGPGQEPVRWRDLLEVGPRSFAVLADGEVYEVSLAEGSWGLQRMERVPEGAARGLVWGGQGLWSLGSGGLWVMGREGWSQALAALPLRPLALSFSEDGAQGLMVGQGGVIYHTQDGGARWSLEGSGTRTDLWDVDISPAGDAWAVGRNGVILRRFEALR